MPTPVESRWMLDAVPISVTAPTSDAHDDAAGALRYLRAQPYDAATAPVLTLAIVDALPPRPAAATHVGRAEPALDVWEADGVLYLHSPAGEARVDVRAGRARLAASGGGDDRDRAGLATLAVLSLLRPHGRFALHASSLAHEGRGVLFVGPSGAGKSTLAYALARAGWAYLSDDLTLLRAGDAGDVEARSLGRLFRLAPPTLAAYAEAREGIRGPGPDGKSYVDVDALHGARFADRAVPRLLLFPRIADQASSTLRPIPRMQALLQLLPQALLADRDAVHGQAQMDVFGRLCVQAPAFELAAGRDVLERPEVLSARLATLLDASTRART